MAGTSYIKDEHINGMRCKLLRERIDDILRKMFHETFPTDSAQLYKKLNEIRENIKKLECKGLLTKEEFNLLLPPTEDRCDSSKFETTLLGKLLFNFCGYKRPQKEPKAKDRSTDANIFRLIKIRNKIEHNTSKVDTDSLINHLREAEKPLLELGCTMDEIKRISNIAIRDAPTKEKIKKLKQSKKNFRYNLKEPVPNFIRRNTEIDQIHSCLAKIDAKDTKSAMSPPLGVVISGDGGVGKSELIRQYCLHYHQKYDVIAWVNAENVGSLRNDFIEIGKESGLSLKQNDESYQPIKNIVQMIYKHFLMSSSFNDSPRKAVLFVFDGLDEPDDIKCFLPGIICMAPHIIVTSRRMDWSPRFEFIRLSMFQQVSINLQS